jgi:hypothetical protein
VLEHLGVREGDRIDFVLDSAGVVRILPVTRSVRRLCWLFREPGAPAPTLAEIKESLLDEIADRLGASGGPSGADS